MGLLTRRVSYELTDTEIGEFYLMLMAAGRERAAYYGCERKSVPEYVALAKRQGAWWLINMGQRPVGCIYVTDISGKCGFVHFAFLPAGQSRIAGIPAPVAIGRFALSGILHDAHVDGTPIVDTLIGKTPVWNAAAIKTALRCGGVKVGVIPSCCSCFDSGRMADGIITYYTRETVHEAWAEI